MVLVLTLTTTTTVLQPFFRDHPGEPVPEANFWTLWCKGRLADHPAGRHSIRTNQCPPPSSPMFFYRPDVLPATQPCQSTKCAIYITGYCFATTFFHLPPQTVVLRILWPQLTAKSVTAFTVILVITHEVVTVFNAVNTVTDVVVVVYCNLAVMRPNYWSISCCNTATYTVVVRLLVIVNGAKQPC